MKKLQLLTLIILFTINAFGQNDCKFVINEKQIRENKNLDVFLDKMKNEKFVVNNNKNSIPKQVRKELDCIAKEFSIANPKENYQKGCEAGINVPKRQLIFLAKSEDVLILSYASGGITSSTHFLFINYDSKSIIDLWTGVGMGIIKHKSLKEITNFISKQRNKKLGLNTNIVSI